MRFQDIASFIPRFRYLAFLLAILVAGVGFTLGLDLPLKLSINDLLPEDSESVRELKNVSKEVGGDGYFMVLVGPIENPQSYLPRIEQALTQSNAIRYVFYERDTYLLRNKSLYLMPRSDFDGLVDSVKTLFIMGEDNPFSLGLLEADREEKARAFLDDFKSRYKSEEDMSGERARYFISKDGKYALALAKPNFDAGDLGKCEMLVKEARALLNPVFAGAPYRLVGRYVDKVTDTLQIQKDIQKTAVVCFVVVLFLLVLGLGSIIAAVFNLAVVGLSLGWTAVIAHITVGQINILTAFLIAILGGLGVEYGIHLFRRYYQERALIGATHESAFQITYIQMGRALASAALTSSAAFLILSLSDFRGFSEFGRIAGGGILSVYCVYMLTFPAMAQWLRAKPLFGNTKEIFGYYPVTANWKWLLVPFAIICVWGVSRSEFEYNFKRMHNLSAETERSNLMVGDLFGRSVSPSALLATDQEQALALQDWLGEKKETVQEVVSLARILPKDMAERYKQMPQFRRWIKQVPNREVLSATGFSRNDIREWLRTKPYTREELPRHISDSFGTSGNVVVAYPAKDLDFAKPLREFASVLSEARTKFSGMQVGSEVRIFVEILDQILVHGRFVLALFLLGALAVFWLDFRSLRDALDLELQLILGMVLLVGLMGLFQVRFSILNVAIIPAVLAAGIDMGVHVRHRELLGYGSIDSARFIAQAVQLSALATIAGFASLFFAEAGVLKGIAWIAVLGQLSMYLVCLVIRPILRDAGFALRRRIRSAES